MKVNSVVSLVNGRGLGVLSLLFRVCLSQEDWDEQYSMGRSVGGT